MKTVFISFLGTTLDNKGIGVARWESWRPSVDICRQDDLVINEYHLIYGKRFASLAKLVIEDIRVVSPETEMIEHVISFEDPWGFEEVYARLHDFTKSQDFEPGKNEYLIHITTGTHVAQICLFLLTEARYFPGKLLQSIPPARDKTLGTFTIIDLDLSCYDRIATRFRQQITDDISLLKSGIRTRNKAFNHLISQIEAVAVRSVDPILLTGPTGAGKSLLAGRIFELKKARSLVSGIFVEINCATLRGDVAMSALFGHKKGSFTGALTDRPGLLKSAHQGVVFLDEVGELGLDEQAMLLRAIEEKRFMPLGADKETGSDFQLICGTNRNLGLDVEKGLFREDLMARIDMWTFRLPGLAERREDIAPNIDYELLRLSGETGMNITFSKETRKRFLEFAASPGALWKANFRDLNGSLRRMGTLAPGGRITNEVLAEEVNRLKLRWHTHGGEGEFIELTSLVGEKAFAAMDLFDRLQISQVVKVCRSCRTLSEAGRKLFAVSRQKKGRSNDADRLRKYLGKFGLNWGDLKS